MLRHSLFSLLAMSAANASLFVVVVVVAFLFVAASLSVAVVKMVMHELARWRCRSR